MKAFVFDIDGVLIRGGKALSGAKTALQLLNRQKIPWIVLTNGGGMTEERRVANLTDKLGISVHRDQFLQSHTPFRDMASKFHKVLVVGGDSDKCRVAAQEYGFKDVVIPMDIVHAYPDITPYKSFTSTFVGAKPLINPSQPFDGIFVFHDSRDATTDLQLMVDLLRSDKGVLGTRADVPVQSMPIYFSNGDMEWVADYPLPRFGQGALISAMDALWSDLTGNPLEKTVIGKPTKVTYDYANKLLQSWAPEKLESIYMVGDNQYSDIMGANDYGWESCLVRTGVFKDTDPMVTNPTFICDDVLSAVETALSA